MANFKRWLDKKLAESLEDGNGFRFNSNDDAAGDYEVAMKDLTQVMMSKYNQEFIQFVGRIADERGDRELERLIKKVAPSRGSSPESRWKPKRHRDPDEVVAPTADRGHDQNQGE